MHDVFFKPLHYMALAIRGMNAQFGPYGILVSYLLFTGLSAWQFSVLHATQTRQADTAKKAATAAGQADEAARQAAATARIVAQNQINARDSAVKQCSANREALLNAAALYDAEAENDLAIARAEAADFPLAQSRNVVQIVQRRGELEHSSAVFIRANLIDLCQYKFTPPASAKKNGSP